MKKIIVSFLCAIIFMQAGISAYATREDYHTNAEITFFRKGEISDNDFSYFFRLDDKSANSPVYGTLVFIPYYISDENATDRPAGVPIAYGYASLDYYKFPATDDPLLGLVHAEKGTGVDMCLQEETDKYDKLLSDLSVSASSDDTDYPKCIVIETNSYFAEITSKDGRIIYFDDLIEDLNEHKIFAKSDMPEEYTYDDYQKNTEWISKYVNEDGTLAYDISENILSDVRCIDFKDVEKPSSWAEDEVWRAINYDLTTESVTDYPHEYINREEFAEMIVKCVEKIVNNPISDTNNPFTDINNSAVTKAFNMGIVSGVGDNLFEPDKDITRQEISTMLYRAIQYIEKSNNQQYFSYNDDLGDFFDKSNVSDWAKEAVGNLINNDIIHGNDQRFIKPLKHTTKEEAILLILRIYEAINVN